MESDYILEWFRFADMDLLSAERLTTHYPVHMQLVCYLCEQSAEKNIKGFLVYNGITEPPKIHNLEILCDRCSEFSAEFANIYDQCESLTRYGVQPRYPHEMEITEQDMKKALEYAKQIKEFAPLQVIRQELEQAIKEEETPPPADEAADAEPVE